MRAAIIGCGPSGPARGGAHSISYAHGWAMRHAGEAKIQLVAAASRKEKNRDDFVAEFPGVNSYEDYRVMLKKERPEFVVICAFPPDREAMVQAALEAGAKALWVEKPFAISMGSACRMIEAAKTHGARIFVNFQRRFGKPFEWVKQAIAAGRIGRVISAQITQPGPQLIDFGPHLIDAALNMMNVPGERTPTKVLGAVEWSDNPYQGVPAEQQLIGTVRFSDGARLTIETGSHTPERVPIIRINGEEGFAELRLSPLPGEPSVARGLFRDGSGISILKTDENFHHGNIDKNLYVDRALLHLLDAIATGAPSELDASAVLPGLEVLLALFESSHQRRMLDLPLAQQESPFHF